MEQGKTLEEVVDKPQSKSNTFLEKTKHYWYSNGLMFAIKTLDVITTYKICNRDGIGCETSEVFKDYMANHGIAEGLIIGSGESLMHIMATSAILNGIGYGLGKAVSKFSDKHLSGKAKKAADYTAIGLSNTGNAFVYGLCLYNYDAVIYNIFNLFM